MRNRRSLFIFLVLLWPIMLHAGPADPVEFIQLKGRTAEEMIPLLKPLLKQGDALTGTGYQLIIRTDRQTLSDVRAVINQLDHAQRNLLISVRRGKAGEAQHRQVDASGSVRLKDNVRVGAGDTNRDGVSVRIKDNRLTTHDSGVQQLRVLEGQRAFINTGQEVPYPDNQVVVTQGQTIINRGTIYHKVDRGFYVLPRLSGDRVTLSITSSDGNVLPDKSIAVQETATVVQGRVGEWIQIGGISEQSDTSSRGILSAQSRQSSHSLDIYVKVEPE